jgi:hypothetical protein
MLAGASLTEESVEGVVTATHRFVRGHLTVRLDAMLQTIQFPACVADLHTGLAHVDRNALALYKNTMVDYKKVRD